MPFAIERERERERGGKGKRERKRELDRMGGYGVKLHIITRKLLGASNMK